LAGIAEISLVGRAHGKAKPVAGVRGLSPTIAALASDIAIPVKQAKGAVTADLVIWHGAERLATATTTGVAINARCLAAVFHDAPTTSSGTAKFDLAFILDLLETANLGGPKVIVPGHECLKASMVSALASSEADSWALAPQVWSPVLLPELAAPSATIADRRGRAGGRGLNDLPQMEDLEMLFPHHASNLIIDDGALAHFEPPEHWRISPSASMPLSRFFREIDFFLWVPNPNLPTAPTAEFYAAIAAGKLVLTDHQSAAAFGPGVVGCAPSETNAIISAYLADPSAYQRDVLVAQETLGQYSADATRQRWSAVMAEFAHEAVA